MIMLITIVVYQLNYTATGMMILILWGLITAIYGKDESTLFYGHGILNKDHGTVYLDTNDAYFSVLLHVAIPHFRFDNMPNDCIKTFSCGTTLLR